MGRSDRIAMPRNTAKGIMLQLDVGTCLATAMTRSRGFRENSGTHSLPARQRVVSEKRASCLFGEVWVLEKAVAAAESEEHRYYL